MNGGQWQIALQLLSEMLRTKLVPSIISFNVGMSACIRLANGRWPCSCCQTCWLPNFYQSRAPLPRGSKYLIRSIYGFGIGNRNSGLGYILHIWVLGPLGSMHVSALVAGVDFGVSAYHRLHACELWSKLLHMQPGSPLKGILYSPYTKGPSTQTQEIFPKPLLRFLV